MTEVAVAREPAGRRSTDDAESDQTEANRPEFWSELRIDPVEIALPKGTGYTLRAYRLTTEITPTDVTDRENDEFPELTRRPVEEEIIILDDKFNEEAAADDEEAPAPTGKRRRAKATTTDASDEDDSDVDEDNEDLDDEDDDDLDDDDLDDEDDEDEDDDESDDEEDDGTDLAGDSAEAEEAAAEPAAEDIPVFLGHGGQLYLFRTVEGLVEFVQSGAEHDLSQLAEWPAVVEQITSANVIPLPEDSYELDLVVENLRGGHDAWDPELLIQAGEAARDLGFALQLNSVVDALSPGSPLDDLDEALRTTAGGGFGGFLGRRKLKKIGAEAAPLGWRTIIGKISAVVDWRD
jgi:hypothetical protein